MSLSLRRRTLILGLGAFVSLAIFQAAFAEDEDLVHIVSGTVKHVDKGAKTVVVKTDDGTENTFKWTGKTAFEGLKGAGKGITEGSKLSVKYTEKGGEKTAVGIKDVGKETKKAVD